MRELEIRQNIVDIGKQLLEEKLVVRSWGSLSCRYRGSEFFITPRGVDYETLDGDVLALYDYSTNHWLGKYMPSTENDLHALAYELFPEVEFVIHTHQPYACALGLCGGKELDLSPEEEAKLEGIAVVGHGLPATRFLKSAVKKAMFTGAHIIFIQHHGVLVAGSSKEDAFEKAVLLEKICKRNWKGQRYIKERKKASRHERMKDQLLESVQKELPNAAWADQDAPLTWSKSGHPLTAQLDDVAEMFGRKISMIETDPEALDDVEEISQQLISALLNEEAVLLKGHGAMVCPMEKADTENLKALVDKAAISALHTNACKVHKYLSAPECGLLQLAYHKKRAEMK